MPPKKPARRNNKKKKGKHDQTAQAVLSPEPLQEDIFAGVDGVGESHNVSSDGANSGSGGGIYGIYKRATQRFKDGLMALVPKHFFETDRVQALMDAVDFIVDQQQQVDAVLLDDCRLSLQFRKRYSKSFGEAGDGGHHYFILVLNYCYHSLKHLVPKIEKEEIKEKRKKFSFTDLELESDSEDEEDKEDKSPSTTQQPVRPPEPKDGYTIDDLVESTDSIQAILFLLSVEEAMEGISLSYIALKRNARCISDDEDEDASYLMAYNLANAIKTNCCIHQVQLMEEQLAINLPHLNTIYRVLGCVFLKDQIDNLYRHLQEHGKGVTRQDVTAFVGDIVEQVFRSPNGRLHEKVVSDFCGEWSLPVDGLADDVEAVVALACVQTILEAMRPADHAKLFGSHVWMRDRKYVGGDRSILNTLALLQRHAQSLKPGSKTKVLAKIGAYGALWNEQRCMAQKIQGDMDQLLMHDILPELLFSCEHGYLSQNLPRLGELLPLFKLLRDFARNPTKPVPMSLTFGIHAILTSIYEVQGHKDVAAIATAAKTAYNTFFDQLDEQLHHLELLDNSIWLSRIKSLKFGKQLPVPIGRPISGAEERAFWNPYCAGLFLAYLTYCLNMEGGAPLLDGLCQVRMVLHLYNAFKLRNLVEKIPLLDSLDKYFAGVQSVWGGGKATTRETILKTFWIAIGMRLDVIRSMHEHCRCYVLEKSGSLDDRPVNTRDGGFARETAKYGPGDISKAYRRICLKDFRDIVDTEEIPQVSAECDRDWNLNFVRLVNDTLNTMYTEEELVSWNWIALGGFVNSFIYFLAHHLGWELYLERVVTGKNSVSDTYAVRGAQFKLFAMHLLGPLEFLDSVESDRVLIAARNCLVEFFVRLDSSKYLLFNTFVDDDD